MFVRRFFFVSSLFLVLHIICMANSSAMQCNIKLIDKIRKCDFFSLSVFCFRIELYIFIRFWANQKTGRSWNCCRRFIDKMYKLRRIFGVFKTPYARRSALSIGYLLLECSIAKEFTTPAHANKHSIRSEQASWLAGWQAGRQTSEPP